MSTVLMYLVASGAKSAEDEEAFRRSVGVHLAALDDALSGVEVQTSTTGKSVVSVQLTAEGRLAADAAKNIKLYFAGLGVKSLSELPTRALRSGSRFVTLPAPRRIAGVSSTQNNGLFIEELLVEIAKHGAARPQDLAGKLNHSVAEIESVLANLATSGFVVGSVESVFSLTEEGEVEAGGAVAGRKAVMELFLASGCSLSVQDISATTGAKSDTSTKRVVRRLIDEGMLEVDEKTQKGDGTKPRRLYRLTARGRHAGADYTPQLGRPKGWMKLTPARWGVVVVMLKTHEPLVRSELARLSGVSLSGIKAFMIESEAKGYVESRVVSEGPLTYGFTLTDAGREAARTYEGMYGIPSAASANKAGGTVVESAAEEPKLFAEPTALTAVYRVDVRKGSPEVAALIAQLSSLDGVHVELLRQVG
jgi:predicted ArsR family transcriptional regulator